MVGEKALRKRSQIVTKVAMVRVNMMIRRCGRRRFRIRLTTRLLQISTKITLRPMVRAGLTAVVTASGGHMPIKSRNVGFSSHSPAKRVFL